MTIGRAARRFLLAGLSVVWMGGLAEIRAQEPLLVLRNVTIIDPVAATVGAARARPQTIIIEGSRIKAVAPSEDALPPNARVVDGTGRFAIPALWDMHAHVPGDPADARAALRMQYANGVLHMRDMGTDMPLDDLRTLMAQTRERNEPLARIVSTPWHIVHGRDDRRPPTGGDAALFQVEDRKEADKLVRFVAAQKIDFIKPYDSMSAPAFRALAAAAERQGIAISGHIPRQVPVGEALALGQAAIEHAQSLTWACAPTPDGARRDYYLAEPHRRFEANLAYPGFAKFTADVAELYDKETCLALMKSMAERDVRYVPTLVTRRFDVLAAFREYREDPLMAYIDADAQKGWRADAANYASLDPASRVALYRVLLHAMALTAEAYRLGVPVLVGSDSPDSYVFPGFSYHLEMEMLAEAGMPPLAVLRAATWEAARFAKEEKDYGSIAPGRIADILLLDADPLLDIANTRRIHAVIAAGRLSDRASLDTLLAEVRKNAAAIGGDRHEP